MFLDARAIPTGTAIEADLCIVSGGMELDADTQDLYGGRSVGRPFSDLTVCRLRYFGGTTNHWGGWCCPLDQIDFEEREGLPYHGWPFGKSELDPWYRR